mmetsp:Transcript_26604/g.76689  ORF Transcript_26604/g.76689 Transcript_26604/m.76689 type:complete len:229 (+) Transcript_26604:356-1042(+)
MVRGRGHDHDGHQQQHPDAPAAQDCRSVPRQGCVGPDVFRQERRLLEEGGGERGGPEHRQGEGGQELCARPEGVRSSNLRPRRRLRRPRHCHEAAAAGAQRHPGDGEVPRLRGRVLVQHRKQAHQAADGGRQLPHGVLLPGAGLPRRHALLALAGLPHHDVLPLRPQVRAGELHEVQHQGDQDCAEGQGRQIIFCHLPRAHGSGGRVRDIPSRDGPLLAGKPLHAQAS